LKPNIFRICKNHECSQYDKEILLEQDEEKWFYASPFCNKCHKEGELKYSHKGIEAKDSESFYAIVNGLAKEFHLLKRMIDKDIAEPDDIARHEEILSKIDGLECIGCGQQFIHHEH
jgi:hypothetical protein